MTWRRRDVPITSETPPPSYEVIKWCYSTRPRIPVHLITHGLPRQVEIGYRREKKALIPRDFLRGRTLVSHLDIHWENVIWENATCVACRPHQKVRNVPVRERKMQRRYCMPSRTCQMRTCRSWKWRGNKDTSMFRSGVMVCARFKSCLTVCTRVGDHRGRSRVVKFLSLVFHHTDTPRRVTYISLLFSSHFIVS